MATSKNETVSFPAPYEPGSLTSHKDDGGGKYIGKAIDTNVKSMASAPTITHGSTSSWKDFGLLYSMGTGGGGIFEKTYSAGNVGGSWGATGSKHSEIIKVGGNHGMYLATGTQYEHTGIGFELFRRRTDSDKNNNNAERHCIFLRRWGVELVSRTSGSTRFWSSSELDTNGLFGGGSSTGSGKRWEYKFYKMMFKDVTGFAHESYTTKALWFNFTTKDGSYVGDATTEVKVYNCRFYHDFHSAYNSGNSWIKPAYRAYADRNKNMYKFG